MQLNVDGLLQRECVLMEASYLVEQELRLQVT